MSMQASRDAININKGFHYVHNLTSGKSNKNTGLSRLIQQSWTYTRVHTNVLLPHTAKLRSFDTKCYKHIHNVYRCKCYNACRVPEGDEQRYIWFYCSLRYIISFFFSWHVIIIEYIVISLMSCVCPCVWTTTKNVPNAFLSKKYLISIGMGHI